MDLSTLPTEVILSQPHTSLGKLYLDWIPQPGSYLEVTGQTYQVLERHHRYCYRSGSYRLHNIALHVQIAHPPAERTLLSGRWVIGDITCRFNARSEFFRCAVNPTGPCDGCPDWTRV